MVVFAVERANADLLMFLLALATGLLTKYRLPLRLFGYVLGLVAALIKYYPIMILVVAFRERISTLCLVSLATVGSLAVFWTEYRGEIVRGVPGISRGPYNTDLFSAENLPYLLGKVAGNAADSPLVERIAAGGLYAVMVSACVALCWRLWRSVELRTALASLPRLDRVLLVIGSAVIVGCFFAGQSIGYRGVFLLLVMPGLLAIARGSDRDARVLGVGTSVVIGLLMWSECFRLALWASELEIQFWLLRELCWWWIVSVMLAVVADFLADSPIVRSASSLLDGSTARTK
jgi:hypothetical protein